jgi:hypothetical protein
MTEIKNEIKNNYENEINENVDTMDMTSINNDVESFMPYENDEYTKYNPLHKELGITLTTNVKYEKRLTYNKYEIIDKNGERKECFKKFITLVDYVKFLIGKYKNDPIHVLPGTESTGLFQEYINSYHNYAYVDGFFYYLSSSLLQKGFVHGLDFYDSYICISNECEIDIVDDFEYLCDSNFFSENLNKQFYFKDENLGDFFDKKKPIVISKCESENINVEFEELEEFEEFEELEEFDAEYEFNKEDDGNEFDIEEHEAEQEEEQEEKHEHRDDLLQRILFEIQSGNIEQVKEFSKMLTVEQIELLYQATTQKETGQKRPPSSIKEKKPSVFMTMKSINY